MNPAGPPRHFHTELAQLKTVLLEMSSLAEELVRTAVEALTERDQAKAVLKNCATADTNSVKHYFEVSTGEELNAAFQEIISNSEKIALIK